MYIYIYVCVWTKNFGASTMYIYMGVSGLKFLGLVLCIYIYVCVWTKVLGASTMYIYMGVSGLKFWGASTMYIYMGVSGLKFLGLVLCIYICVCVWTKVLGG